MSGAILPFVNVRGCKHMKSLYAKSVLFGGMLLLLAGCQEQNPLLGQWKLVKTPDLSVAAFKMAEISGNAKITFEEERMVSGGHAVEVSYAISGDEVTVKYVNGADNTYVVENGDHFTFDIPKAGKFKYVRVH